GPCTPTSCLSTQSTTTAIPTLSLHDALPISRPLPAPWPPRDPALPAGAPPAGVAAHHGGRLHRPGWPRLVGPCGRFPSLLDSPGDRKSTRLNSSHVKSSYAVFCLKKKTARQR